MAVSNSVSLPHGTMGWSTVCDCGISWSYSRTFYPNFKDMALDHSPEVFKVNP